MATAKRKKSSPGTSFQRVEPANSALSDSPQLLAATSNSLDDEPKVSFTLEFYPVDEKESAFIGRLKKIGSEEQITLINDLDSEVLLGFIRRNLPKTWRKQQHYKTLTQAEAAVDSNSTPKPLAQNPICTPVLASKVELLLNEQLRGKLEVWQNGRKSNVIEASKTTSLHFEADAQQWTEYHAHFKSLETNVPSHSIVRKQTTNGQVELVLSQDQLKPGIYDLKFSAVAAGNEDTNGRTRFTANQLIQVI